MDRNCFTPETFTCQCSARRGRGFLIVCQVTRPGELGSEQRERDCRVMLLSDQRIDFTGENHVEYKTVRLFLGGGGRIWMALPAWTHVTLSWKPRSPGLLTASQKIGGFIPSFTDSLRRQSSFVTQMSKGLSCLFW